MHDNFKHSEAAARAFLITHTTSKQSIPPSADRERVLAASTALLDAALALLTTYGIESKVHAENTQFAGWAQVGPKTNGQVYGVKVDARGIVAGHLQGTTNDGDPVRDLVWDLGSQNWVGKDGKDPLEVLVTVLAKRQYVNPRGGLAFLGG